MIGKYSSFTFRDSKDSPAQIGAALGVAHLIHGSVRQQGERIRVTIGMIRAADGSSVWSHTYDDQLKDVFAIQTRIAVAVAGALQVKLLGQKLGVDDRPPSGNVEAYRLMLQGRASSRQGTKAGIQEGIALLQQAIKLDPDYAYAWGALSNSLVNLVKVVGAVEGEAAQQALVQARVAADRQQELAPNASDTHKNRGYLLGAVDYDQMGALNEYRRAYALAPNDGTTMAFLSGGLRNAGQLEPAAKLMRKAIATDPLRADFYSSLSAILLGQGKLDAAEQALGKAQALQPDFGGMDYKLAKIEILRGDAAAAQRIANRLKPNHKAWALAASLQIVPGQKNADAAVQSFIAGYSKQDSYNVAQLYALRKQPDAMYEWLERARTQDSGGFMGLLYDPFFLPYQRDPRFAALCKRAGLPVPAEPMPDAATTGNTD